MNKPPVDALFPSLDAKIFIERYWRKESCCFHGSLERFPNLPDELCHFSLSELAGITGAQLRAVGVTSDKYMYGESLTFGDYADVFLSLSATIVIDNTNVIFPTLTNLERQVEDWIQLPPKGCQIRTVLGKGATQGLPLHFDRWDRFELQLQGERRLSFAPNQHVQYPLDTYFSNLPLSERLASICRLPLPEKMPQEATEVTLSPGSALYVPCGFWQMSENHQDSVSLRFRLGMPAWIRLLPKECWQTVVGQVRWREAALGLWGRKEQRERALEHMAALLHEDFPELKLDVNLLVEQFDFDLSL